MDLTLDDVEVRVLGALVEKEATTPDYYPLSLNALVNACNQKSNREPVVAYDEETVEDALERLRAKGLAVRITGGDARVPKHAHRLGETFNLGRPESAVLCVLMLRGPQTVGELRGRTERMYAFDGLEAVENCLARLAESTQPGPLVARLPRQAGSRDARYGHLLSGALPSVPEEAPRPAERPSPLEARVEQLEREIAALRAEWEVFRKQFE